MSGKTDALSPLAGAAVAQLHPPHFDRTDPRLDHPLRPQPVPHQALAPIGQLYALHRGQEHLGLRLDGLGKQPTSAAPQDDCQRIVDRVGLTEWDNRTITRHGVSLLREVQAGFHPPRYAAFLTKPSPSFGYSSAESAVFICKKRYPAQIPDRSSAATVSIG